MNLKNEMLKVVDTEATDILNIESESEKEAKKLGFCNDDQKADDILYWLGSIKREEDELTDYMEREIDRIKRFTESKLKSLHRKRSFFEATLESYFSTCKGKSLKLSNGSFGHRKQQDKVIVEDEPKFLKWVQGSNLNHLTKVTYKPVLKEIKEYVKSSAELPDGLHFIEGKPKFYAKANETV